MPDFTIKGNPGGIRSRAQLTIEKGQAFFDTGEALAQITTDGWTGRAAEKWIEAAEAEPERWTKAGNGFVRAGNALNTYATALENAQSTAEWAEGEYARGEQVTQDARASYDADVSQARATANSYISRGMSYDLTIHPFNDPGAEIRQNALSELETAKAELEAAADTCAGEVRAGCRDAPEEPNWFESGLKFVGGIVAGAGEALWDLAKLTAIVPGSPMWFYETTQTLTDLATGELTPEEWAKQQELKLETAQQTLQALKDDPVEFGKNIGKAMLDWDTWADDPARAIGHLVPDAIAAVATGGAGAAATRGVKGVTDLAGALASLGRHGDDIAGGAAAIGRHGDDLADLGDLGDLGKLPDGLGPGALDDLPGSGTPGSPGSPKGPDGSPQSPDAPESPGSGGSGSGGSGSGGSGSGGSGSGGSGSGGSGSPGSNGPGSGSSTPETGGSGSAGTPGGSGSTGGSPGSSGGSPGSSGTPGGNGPGQGPHGNGPDGNGPGSNGQTPDGNGPGGNGPDGNGPGGNGPDGNGPDGDGQSQGPDGDGPDGDGPDGDGPDGDGQSQGPEGDGPDGNGNDADGNDADGNADGNDADTPAPNQPSDKYDDIDPAPSDNNAGNQLDRPEVQEWITKVHEEHPELSREQIEGMYDYTTNDGYDTMNAALRGDPADITPEVQTRIDNARAGLDRLDNFEGTTWRGTNLPQSALDRVMNDGILSDKAFSSTSVDPDVTRNFINPGKDNPVRIEIDGHSGSNVGPFSAYRKESEILFDGGIEFEVIGKPEMKFDPDLGIEVLEIKVREPR